MITSSCKRIAIRSGLKFNVRQVTISSVIRASDTEKNDAITPPTFLEEEEVAVDPKMFNKSGLLNQDRNKLHNKVPYSEPHSWIHLSEKYQRKMFGRYGSESGVNPSICFPSKHDIASQAAFEKLQEPVSLSMMMQKVNEEKLEKLNQIKKRENEIAIKLTKLGQWRSELYAKVSKKEADTLAAKARKERLIEEVRRHFGFKVDPKDDRFKEMLEQKEKEDKKLQKEAKRKAKEEKMMAKLVQKKAD